MLLDLNSVMTVSQRDHCNYWPVMNLFTPNEIQLRNVNIFIQALCLHDTRMLNMCKKLS